MRIIHTSDWHLGKILHERSLLEDQEFFLQSLIDFLKKAEANDPVDALLVAGDIFDRSSPPAAAVQLFSDFLSQLSSNLPDLTVVMISGNHDNQLRLGYGAPLFEKSKIHIRTRPETMEDPVTIKSRSGEEQLVVFTIPFLFPGSMELPEPDQSLEQGGESTEPDLFNLPRTPREKIDELQIATDRIYASQAWKENEESFRMAISHCFTTGGEESDSERIFVGSTGHVPASVFSRFDYVALGHLHKPQKASKNSFYSGSPLKYSFSEAGDEKGILSLKIEGKEFKQKKIKLPILRDTIRIDLDAEELEGRSFSDSERNSYLELILRGPGALVPSIAMLREKFPHLLSVRRFVQEAENSQTTIKSRERGRTPLDEYKEFYNFIYHTPPPAEQLERVQEAIQEIEVDLHEAG